MDKLCSDVCCNNADWKKKSSTNVICAEREKKRKQKERDIWKNKPALIKIIVTPTTKQSSLNHIEFRLSVVIVFLLSIILFVFVYLILYIYFLLSN